MPSHQTPAAVHSPTFDADAATGRHEPPTALSWARPAWRGALLGLLPVAVWALVSAQWMPRGPTSTGESLACLAAGLLLGLVAGWLARSRWAIITAPVTFIVCYELARWGVSGPTVDGVRLSMYGAIAVVTGRFFHGLVAVLPMIWAAAAGAGLARRGTRQHLDRESLGSRIGRWSRRTGHSLTAVALLALAVLLARPSSTAPVVGPGGASVPGSIAELTTVDVAGHDLGLMIRGRDQTHPVLLFLAGGPGGSELGAMRRHLVGLESHFVVATWDQRGTGRSYGELDPADTLTLDSSIRDTLAVTDYLRDRFGRRQIYLVGQSWGSTLGVLAIQRAPEKYAAFVGVGQMVSQRATDQIYYDDTLAWAQRTGQQGLVDELRQIGPPPYADPRHYETVLSHEMELYPYDHSRNSEGQGQMSENLIVPEYSLTEQVRILAGTLDTFATLYPQLQDIDFRRTATTLEVPVFFVQGAHETPGRARLFDQWYPRLAAPIKDRVVFDTSGHRPLFEQPTQFVDYLTDVVVPRTAPPGPA